MTEATHPNATFFHPRAIRLLAPALWLLFPGSAFASPAPAEQRIPSFAISQRAQDLIGPMERQGLGEDSKFLSVLGTVLRDPAFSAADRADTFFLMLRKIGWSFTGTQRIPDGFSYFGTSEGIAATLLGYQDYFETAQLDTKGLLELAGNDCATHVVRCSHALLLATMVDRRAATASVAAFIDPARIKSVEVPDILLHHLALSAVLTRDIKVAVALGSLLRVTPGEEAQEDILNALGMFSGSETAMAVEAFLLSAVETKLDSAVETGILVFRKLLHDPDVFRSRYEQLALATADPERRASLQALQKEEFASLERFGAGGGWTKFWDGADVVLYDDGMSLSFGSGFRDFVPR